MEENNGKTRRKISLCEIGIFPSEKQGGKSSARQRKISLCEIGIFLRKNKEDRL